MRRGRSNRVIIIVLLIIMSLSMTVVFAALSQTLSINTSAKIQNGSWNILFSNLNHITTGSGVDDNSAISGSTSINISAIMTMPGDKVSYTFDVVNSGTINAVLHDVLSNGNFAEFPEIKYTLTYDNDLLYGNSVPASGNSLIASEMKTMKLDIWFDSEATHVESEDRVLNFTIDLIYIQSN